MKVWQKALIIFIGCGISGVCTFLTPLYPAWITALGAVQIAVITIVALVTGFKPTT